MLGPDVPLVGAPGPRARKRRGRRWFAVVALAPLAVLPGVAAAQPRSDPASVEVRPATLGQPPPEWRRNAAAWPGHNYDLANTRATTTTPISSRNVSHLREKWRLPLEGQAFFGIFASNPIVLDDTIYLIDLTSQVYAVDKETGRVKWRRAFNDFNVGPNGVAYGWGLLFGTTHTGIFALDARTGETVWSRELIGAELGGIDLAPQVYDNTVIVSTVPSALDRYVPGTMGIVYALDPWTGATKWDFNTVKDGYLWGNPELNSGGGLWYPPAVDAAGRVFISIGNPGPFPGTPEFPNGTSRPGDNLYTNSIVALDGQTGRLLWYQQVAPHDLRDYDLQISPIVTHVPIDGVRTEIVVVAGKMGAVYAYRADDGTPLWSLSVGRHENDTGLLPDDPIPVLPGLFGGVETPMAVAHGAVFVPWVDLAMNMSSTTYEFPDVTQGTGGLVAADVATGRVRWKRDLPQMSLGGATVANDVVFASSFDGTTYAFDTRTGRTLWTAAARAGINSFPAVAGDTLLVGAAAPLLTGQQAMPELIAYSLD